MYFLFSAYKASYWYWEFTQILRKILLTATFSLVSNTFDQAMLGFGIVIAASLAHVGARPYLDSTLNNLESCLLIGTLVTVVGGLVIQHYNVEGADANGSAVLASLIVLVINGLCVVVLAVALFREVPSVFPYVKARLGSVFPCIKARLGSVITACASLPCLPRTSHRQL